MNFGLKSPNCFWENWVTFDQDQRITFDLWNSLNFINLFS